jgi:hypothetical protein
MNAPALMCSLPLNLIYFTKGCSAKMFLTNFSKVVSYRISQIFGWYSRIFSELAEGLHGYYAFNI